MKRRQFLSRGMTFAAGGAGLMAVGCGGSNSGSKTPTARPTSSSSSSSSGTAAASSSCSPFATCKGSPKQGGTLRATSIGGSLLPIDPHQSLAESQGQIWDTVGGTLLRASRSLVLRPYLAQSWESPDPTTWIFHLYPNIKYDPRPPVNGRQFTADDVVYNVQRAANPDPKFLMAKPKFKFMDKVEAVDPTTVKFTMKKPYAPFANELSIGFWFVAKESIEKYGDANTLDAVHGPGPYMLTALDTSNYSIRLERNPNYFQQGIPHCDKIETTYYSQAGSAAAAMISGQLDVYNGAANTDVKALDSAGTKYYKQNAFSAGHFPFELNTQKQPFQDQRVRQALNLAIDRQALVRLTSATSSAGDPVGVISSWLTPWALSQKELYSRPGWRTPKDQDLATAKQLLSAAGFTASNPLKFDSIAWTQWSGTFAVWVQDWMKTIGVEMSIKNVDTYAGLISQEASKNYNTAVSGYSIGFEPDDQVYDFYYSSGLRNVTSYNDPKIDSEILAQEGELDTNKRIQLVQQMQRDILDSWPGLIWLHDNGILTILKQNIYGFENTPDSVHDYRYDQVWIA